MQSLISQVSLQFSARTAIDKIFVEHLQRQDSQCWDMLLNHFASRLRKDIGRSLQKRSLDVEWIEDIEQDTWLTAVRQIRDFQWQSEEKLYNWLRSIATNHVKNLAAKRRNTDISFEALDDCEDMGLTVDFFLYIHDLIEVSPELEVILHENMIGLDQVLQVLKPREREILLRRVLHHESVPQLAKEYNVKPATISVILVRAKHMLRAYIECCGN